MSDCTIHRFHSPRPHVLVAVDDREVCPTGAENIQALFELYEEYGETPPWEVRRQFGPGERTVVAERWRAVRVG